MPKLMNQIVIHAPRNKVWDILSDIELLEQYDPITTKSEAISTIKNGVGAARKCEVLPSGWFKEQIIVWEPEKAITFELVDN